MDDRGEYLHRLYGSLMEEQRSLQQRRVSSMKNAHRWHLAAAFNCGAVFIVAVLLLQTCLSGCAHNVPRMQEDDSGPFRGWTRERMLEWGLTQVAIAAAKLRIAKHLARIPEAA